MQGPDTRSAVDPEVRPRSDRSTSDAANQPDSYTRRSARRLLRDRRPAISAGDRTGQTDDGMELSLAGGSGRNAELPGLHHRGPLQQAGLGKVGQRPRRREGDFLPHLLPVDQTLHWANPPGGIGGRDDHGTARTPYRGPVPIVTHVHGAHTTDESDGYAEAWYLPLAKNIPADFAKAGTFYETFRQQFLNEHGADWQPGSATFQYANNQPAATMWYHDHVLGMTRLNVYAGPAGFYLLRGGPFDLPPGQLPSGRYEIPVAVQDRSFNAGFATRPRCFMRTPASASITRPTCRRYGIRSSSATPW
jgi:hypothetical protein